VFLKHAINVINIFIQTLKAFKTQELWQQGEADFKSNLIFSMPLPAARAICSYCTGIRRGAGIRPYR
jgi:hypothetical protein